MNLIFLTDLLGYMHGMVIQVIYKQLLTHIYTYIKRKLQGISTNMTHGLYMPPKNTEYTKYNYSL
jgi:hypothetical protein